MSRGVLPRRERSIAETFERFTLPVRFLRQPRGVRDVAFALPQLSRAPFHLQALYNNPIPVPNARCHLPFVPLGERGLVQTPTQPPARPSELLVRGEAPHFRTRKLPLRVLVPPPPNFEGHLSPKEESLHADYRCGSYRAK